MKKIVMITTGGTIAMKYDSATGGLIPAVSGEDLTEAVPALGGIAEIEVVEFSNVPSGYMTPAGMLELSHLTDQICGRDDVDGVVITHRTDTLEETAYLLDLTLHTEKPVCITGAMRGASDTSWDGPGNILAAVQTAACDEAAAHGGLVVLNDKIHAAREVTKTHSTNTDTFASPYWGPLGYVYFDGPVIMRKNEHGEKIQPDHLEENVYLIRCAAGMDDYLFRCLIQKPAAGVVVEGFGCGNVSPAVKAGIEAVLQAGIPVVLTTRVSAGRVAEVYGYEGSAHSMRKAGILLAGECSGIKARLKLMLVLGLTRENGEIARYFY